MAKKKTRGHIRQRGKNWYAIFSIDGKKFEMVAGPKKEDAQRLLTEKLREADLGLARTEKPLPFTSFVDQWWASYKTVAGLKPSTITAYESILDARIKPFFGQERIDRIKPGKILSFASSLSTSASSTTGSTLKPKTLRNVFALLKQIFEAAVASRMIARSPVDKRLIKLPTGFSEEREFLREDEVKRVLDGIEDAEARMLVMIAIMTGARQGELLALEWDNIDFDASVIRIRKAFSGGVLTIPKTKSAIRDVAIGPTLVRALKEHKLLSGGRSNFVFSNGAGRPLDPANLAKRVLEPALKKAGITRPVTWHGFRHTFASIHLNRGSNIKWVSRQLGHSTVQMTMDTYGHLIPERHEAAVHEYERLLLGATDKTAIGSREKP